MMKTFGIFSQQVLLPTELQPATVLIQGEKIVEIRTGAPPPRDVEIINLAEFTLMPGLVDSHVHINEPGRTDWEGFHTATQAAAAGGICTVVDMPLNCDPVTTTVGALELKKQATKEQLWVDMGFWGGVVPGNTPDLSPLARAGVLGAKAFLIDSGIDDFPASSQEDLHGAMQKLKAEGLPLLAHAELDLGAPESTLPPNLYHAYLASRPPHWEVEAIKLLINLCRQTGCAVHIVHLSAADAIPILKQARSEGLPITVETCPHYLCLRAEDIAAGQTQYKCAPPIRSADNQDLLWAGLKEGIIDFIVSDHSPCVPNLKCTDTGDFQKAWGGISSLQLGLPSIWTEAKRRGFELSDLAKWLCERPAEFIGQRNTLGKIAPGYHANLVAWNPNESFTVQSKDLLFKHKISPFIGRSLMGKIHSTYLRGKRIFHNGALNPNPQGQFILERNS